MWPLELTVRKPKDILITIIDRSVLPLDPAGVTLVIDNYVETHWDSIPHFSWVRGDSGSKRIPILASCQPPRQIHCMFVVPTKRRPNKRPDLRTEERGRGYGKCNIKKKFLSFRWHIMSSEKIKDWQHTQYRHLRPLFVPRTVIAGLGLTQSVGLPMLDLDWRWLTPPPPWGDGPSYCDSWYDDEPLDHTPQVHRTPVSPSFSWVTNLPTIRRYLNPTLLSHTPTLIFTPPPLTGLREGTRGVTENNLTMRILGVIIFTLRDPKTRRFREILLRVQGMLIGVVGNGRLP